MGPIKKSFLVNKAETRLWYISILLIVNPLQQYLQRRFPQLVTAAQGAVDLVRMWDCPDCRFILITIYCSPPYKTNLSHKL